VKDQYVGDVNDFAKYQLLRVCAGHFDRIVVAWMLTEADGRSDGVHTRYLDDPRKGAADPELFETLRGLVAAEERSIAAIEASMALPGHTFHSTPMPRDKEERCAFFAALAELADPESLLFLDPDNGVEVASVAKHARNSERYVYWDELRLLRDAGASVLVYQHFPRKERSEYLTAHLARLGTELGPQYVTFAAYTGRVGFLFGVREERASALRDAVAERCEIEPLLTCWPGLSV
jgi:hypothetical protein